MASLQVYNSRGVEYVRIVESFRDPKTKKPKVRTIKNLGRKDVLEEKEPGIIERLKSEMKKGGKKYVQLSLEDVELDLNKSILMCKNMGVQEARFPYTHIFNILLI